MSVKVIENDEQIPQITTQTYNLCVTSAINIELSAINNSLQVSKYCTLCSTAKRIVHDVGVVVVVT